MAKKENRIITILVTLESKGIPDITVFLQSTKEFRLVNDGG
jgi:hypothetical protein